MKRKLLIELFYLVITFLVTILFYKIWPNCILLKAPIFNHSSTSAIAFGQMWGITLFIIYSIRQVTLRFNHKTTNIILLLTCVILIIYSILWHQFISNTDTAFLEDGGLALYPPLSSLGNDQFNLQAKQLTSKIIWTFDFLISVAIITILIRTFHKSKKTSH